ncbi:MAG: hypothetical protein IJR70_09430 [Eubacterium sp.]|nr:hypothetical protein [Eubacterium sp.]
MKKTISVILSIIMLVCSLSAAVNAYAYKKSEAPEVSQGVSFSVDQVGISAFKLLSIDINDMSNSDFYCAKFIPEKTAFYEFIFDTDYSGSGSVSMLMAFISDENDKYKNYSVCGEFTDEQKAALEEQGFETSKNPTMSAELEAGKPYYLVMVNVGGKSYKSNVIINEHSHHKYSDKEKSYVDSETLENSMDGAYYNACDSNGCNYIDVTKTIYAVKSISLSKTSYVYNGKEKKPTVTVKDTKGNKISTKNYTVKYSKNVNVGTASVRITFKNDYKGYFVKNFKINPKGTSLKSVTAAKKGFTAKWKKQGKKTSGYQLQYATNSKFTNNKKLVTIKGTGSTSKKVSSLKSKKKYYVRVRTYKTVNNKKYYSAWSAAKTVKTK